MGLPRFGVEEELWVVDPVSREVVPRAADVLGRAAGVLGERACGEITELQVEVRTPPCETAAELLEALTAGRTGLAAVAGLEGLALAASGTPVLGSIIPSPITVGPRQAQGNAMFRGLQHELAISALHVHLDMPDRDLAAQVSNHLRPYLPVLLALSANAPYWDGRDTGYASWRALLWSRWPIAGPPPFHASADGYDRLVQNLQDAGAMVDRGTLFWDVRLSHHLPTLEVRVADVPITVAESALLAVLVRALAVRAVDDVRAGDPGPQISAELLRVAYWRAARDGLSGDGLDLATGLPVPMPELVRRLAERARPALAEDETGLVERVLGGLLRNGDGATRQRRAWARQGSLSDVVDLLTGELTTVSTHA